MDVDIIKLTYHKGGRWVYIDSLKYVGGKHVTEKGDLDFLSFTHMIKKYKQEFGMTEVDKLCYVKPGKKIDDGVLVLDSDEGINDIVASVLDSGSNFCVHVYPFDDIVVNQPFNQPLIDTQCSANLGYAPNDRVLEDDFVLDLINDNCEESMIEKGNSEAVEVNKGKEPYTSDLEVDVEISDAGNEVDSGSESGSEVDSGSGEGESHTSESDSGVEMDLISQSRREVRYDGDAGNPHFLLGMSFANAQEARVAIAKYSIAKCTPLKLNPNEKHRIRAKCKSVGCPFVLFMSQTGKSPGLVVKTFNSEHSCLKDAKNGLATARFLANEFMPIINDKPTMTTKELLKTTEQKMHLYVSKSTCKRAKRIVRTELEGSYINEFGYLGAHIELLKKTNPNTTAELELSEEAMQVGRLVFKRLYICFGALKWGWKAGCRPIIGLDGFHLKGLVKGQVLVAVGKDAADQMFLIAWAVIDKENTDNWKWFLKFLVKDLEINDKGQSITVISDMQKGLVNVVADILPLVEHRYCARHVHVNWSKKWHSGELRKRFWICVWSTFMEEFEDNLKRLGAVSKQAAKDFMACNPQVFCTAFFSTRCKSDMVDNNFCESFNASIRNARFKPIVSMLDEIRESAMARLTTHKETVPKWATNWSPSCMKVYENNLERAFGCKVVFNGDNGYEVGDGDDRHVVRVDDGICTCRQWDVTGIPCSHAIVALNHAQIDPKSVISFWYTKTAYMATYEVSMEPMPSRKFMNVGSFEPCEPPPTVKLSGRPRVKRIRSFNESRKGSRVVQVLILNAKGQKEVGMGLYTETHTGNSTLNPGMSSETIITQRCPIASQPLSFNPDPTIRYPIPNERNIRQEQQASVSAQSSATRRITFAATRTQVLSTTNLPFKPPGPTWNGKPCTTRSALERTQWEMKMGKK